GTVRGYDAAAIPTTDSGVSAGTFDRTYAERAAEMGASVSTTSSGDLAGKEADEQWMATVGGDQAAQNDLAGKHADQNGIGTLTDDAPSTPPPQPNEWHGR